MAMIEEVDRRLHNWARWLSGGMSGALGYASLNLTGVRGGGADGPVIPTNAIEASSTHDEVQRLSSELRRTVELYYLQTNSRAGLSLLLCCSVSTVDARLARAHRQLMDAFLEADQRAHERIAQTRAAYEAGRRSFTE